MPAQLPVASIISDVDSGALLEALRLCSGRPTFEQLLSEAGSSRSRLICSIACSKVGR